MRPLLINGSSYEPLFTSKRVGVQESLIYLIDPVHIRMPFKFSIQTIKKCSILQPSTLDWLSNKCQTKNGWSSIDCTCWHQSIYGIYSRNSDLYYGFQHSWLYASIAFKLFCSSIVIIAFVYRLVRKPKHDTLSVFCVCSIQVILSNMFFQVMYLVTVVLSPTVNVDESGVLDASNSSCTVMGIVFHFVIILQFSSMFMNALLFYFILVKGYFLLEPSNNVKSIKSKFHFLII